MRANVQALTPECVAAGLENARVSPGKIKSVEELWQEFDRARYTPSLADTGSNLAGRLTDLIRSMEAK
ncbi:MAG: hypothetical protein IPN90_06990 [Elusimicrobia bacterium]|nr:hypothetical protein [Elusimicrobiota bacterium]